MSSSSRPRNCTAAPGEPSASAPDAKRGPSPASAAPADAGVRADSRSAATPEQDRARDLRETDERVTRAIDEAKAAAAWLHSSRRRDDDESLHQRLARRTGAGLTSYGLVLEGLDSALAADEAERILDGFPGVRATVVYSPGRAWITAPDDVAPDVLIAALAEHGIGAYLTRNSLRRRATRLDAAPRRRPAVPAAAQQMSEARIRRREAALRAEGSNEVLFTARALVTRTRFIVSLLLSIPVLVLSLYVPWQFPGWQWMCLGLTTIVALWGGWPFHRAMAASMRRRMSALDGASAVAILAGWVWSAGEIFLGEAGKIGFTTSPTWFAFNYERGAPAELFLDVACGVTVLLLAGRLATRYNRVRTGAAMNVLRIPADRNVTVVRKAGKAAKPEKRRVPVAELNIGEDVLVPPGQVIPVDGVVVGGASRVDSRVVGGGSEPKDVKVNSRVWAGSMNLDQKLKVRVSRTGSKTRAAAIQKWLQTAIHEEDVAHQTAVRSASVLVPWTMLLALVAFGIWWLVSGGAGGAFAVALAILIGIAPVALAMSTSTALRIGILYAAERGLLIHDAEAFRSLAAADSVMFNRVGTLTAGEMHVLQVQAAKGENPELILRVAGALMMESDHPVSAAIVRACRVSRDAGSGGGDVPHWIDVHHVEVDADGAFIGQAELPVSTSDGDVEMRFVEASLWRPRDMSALDERMAVAALGGGTPLVISWRGKVRGVITVGEDIKPDAVEAIDELEDMGVDTIMITRDTYPVARRFADRLGISRVYAGIVPGRKAAAVRGVHAGGETVVMVGGSDVAECLRVADVGVLMDADAGVEDLEIEESDVVSLRSAVRSVPEAISLARVVTRTMSANIISAWTYNIAVLALSVAGVLHPLVASVLMVVSGLWIEWRSRRLGRIMGRSGHPPRPGQSRRRALRAADHG
ncbi:heavy metal translocating P-type ATPase [Corynebacterium hansenii]|uniref:Heavy metal translocating P-type ATPase n=1 Tax=Corynebacterium hansenii TaxID=394964 RepID=A0ABV7ZMB7_9CORY|nr:HAD-IC family P-type ATPase [Corynebacterium hansenii]WJY98938.1 putative copper-exporting P-type ATPase V [Corynebacterium hansenii]